MEMWKNGTWFLRTIISLMVGGTVSRTMCWGKGSRDDLLMLEGNV